MEQQKTEVKPQTEVLKPQELKVKVYLSDPITIDDQAINELTLKEPTGDDLKNLSFSDILNMDVRSISLLASRVVCDGVIVDRQLITESGIANIKQILDGFIELMDYQVPDMEDNIEIKGNKVTVTLTNKQKLSFIKPDTGMLRGLATADIYGRQIKAIITLASRCQIGGNMDKQDFQKLSFTNLLLISEGISRLMEGKDTKAPKIIKG